jgi:6-phosphogluconate dehydrogenase (decarboxylating)
LREITCINSADVTPLLEPGDIVVDGGNSYYHDDIRRAADRKAKRLHYVDAGVSGGIWGKERGYCRMIGREQEIVTRLGPILRALAPRQRPAGTTGAIQPVRVVPRGRIPTKSCRRCGSEFGHHEKTTGA